MRRLKREYGSQAHSGYRDQGRRQNKSCGEPQPVTCDAVNRDAIDRDTVNGFAERHPDPENRSAWFPPSAEGSPYGPGHRGDPKNRESSQARDMPAPEQT